MGRTITVVNEEGLPCLTGADERVVNIMDTLTRLMQCPKMLWLDKHKPSVKVIPPQILERLDAGNDFGDRAMGMFGPFVGMTTYLPGITYPDKKDNPRPLDS